MKYSVSRNFTRELFLIKLTTAVFLLLTFGAMQAPLYAATLFANPDFAIYPYIQLGDGRKSSEQMDIIWGVRRGDQGNWKLEYKRSAGPFSSDKLLSDKFVSDKPIADKSFVDRRSFDKLSTEKQGLQKQWTDAGALYRQKVFRVAGAHFFMLSASLEGLHKGEQIKYRICKDGKTVFESQFHAAVPADSPYSFAVFGDCGLNTLGQRNLAYRVFQQKPDFLVIPGDIVYRHGRVAEYLENFFPIYNADNPALNVGAPLMRNTLFVAVPGNHDIARGSFGNSGDFFIFPDGMAYYLLWSQRLNGPQCSPMERNTSPVRAWDLDMKNFLESAGERFPDMATFSFDYGNSHWTVLDANAYMDWTQAKWKDWLEKDLAKSQQATWRFVTFHQPCFISGSSHSDEQRMRLLTPLFEKYKVDLVFTGHVHNYQRSYPLRFKAQSLPGNAALLADGTLPGTFEFDKSFDGKKQTQARFPIYISNGCGGASLTGISTANKPNLWESFTYKVLAGKHASIICKVDGRELKLSLISSTGEELDSFKLTK